MCIRGFCFSGLPRDVKQAGLSPLIRVVFDTIGLDNVQQQHLYVLLGAKQFMEVTLLGDC